MKQNNKNYVYSAHPFFGTRIDVADIENFSKSDFLITYRQISFKKRFEIVYDQRKKKV